MLTAEGEMPVPWWAAIADQHDAEFFATLSKDDRQATERIRRGRVEQGGLRSMPGRLEWQAADGRRQVEAGVRVASIGASAVFFRLNTKWPLDRNAAPA